MKSKRNNKKVIVPNVVRGGTAIPLGNNFYYMKGRKHEDGGIDIGKNARTGLEVEDGEIMQMTNKEAKVFSSVPFLYGGSPAELVLNGANPTDVFNAQEKYKDINNLNDDGSMKKKNGGLSRSKDYGSSKKPYPSIKSKDFAGSNRSYPIPTKADARDALRLAGLHGRNDIKSKVYKKYPELRKKAYFGSDGDYLENLQRELEASQASRIAERERRANILMHTPLFGVNNLEKPIISEEPLTSAEVREILGTDFEGIPTETLGTMAIGDNPYLNGIIYDNPYGVKVARFINATPTTGVPINSNVIDNLTEDLGLEPEVELNPTIANSEVKITPATTPVKTVSNSQPVTSKKSTIIPSITSGVNRENDRTYMELSKDTLRRTPIQGMATTFMGLNIDDRIKQQLNNQIATNQEAKRRERQNASMVQDGIIGGIQALSNIGGNLASYFINNNMLEDLDYVDQPIPLVAQKLKTRININPQLEGLREDIAESERNINNNTASSRVALARNQGVRNRARGMANQLYGQKENMETQLINQDRINRQGVATRNLEQYNRWNQGKTEFENQVRNMQSENAVNLTQGIAGALGDFGDMLLSRNAEKRNLAFMAAANPNATRAFSNDLFNDMYTAIGRLGKKIKLRRK